MPAYWVGWAIVGWFVYPLALGRFWGWFPYPPPPVKVPLDGATDGPRPNPWIVKGLGVIGGLVGGWGSSLLFNADLANPSWLLLSLVGAAAGAVILNDAYALALQGRHRA